jgi:hypothetical protein
MINERSGCVADSERIDDKSASNKAPKKGTKKWHRKIAPKHSTERWHRNTAPKKGTDDDTDEVSRTIELRVDRDKSTVTKRWT